MVSHQSRNLRVGDKVRVPWGLEFVDGEVIEVWGDPPQHVRVSLRPEQDGEPEYLLLNPSVVTRVAA